MTSLPPLPPVIVVLVGIPCATISFIYAMSQGINGAISTAYWIFMGGVCGLPTGYLIAKKKIKTQANDNKSDTQI